uniref:Large ribosomal subunit protein eL28 n=1 Tax=Setaria digitata TaxID=48799 RepID=A0A915Q020_9BILA
MVLASADIQWQIIRKTSSFLRRQRGIPKHFSRERFNIKGVNSIRFNGLVHKKGLDIQAAPDGKGIVVTLKKRTKSAFPAKSTSSVTLKKNSRKSLRSVRNIARNYRNAHKLLAKKRASQLLRSLKPVASRRGRRVRKAEV